jgi:glycosyltransferase 2 family protein
MRPRAKRIWSWVRRIAPWVLAALVLVLVARQARTVDWPAVWDALRMYPLGGLVAAAALSLVSYGLYASFDLVGRHLTGHTLPATVTLLTAAISYAFNLNFGSLIGGIALRLRLYTRRGLAAATAAQIVAHSMLTNWLGYLWIGGVVFVWRPPIEADQWQLTDTVLRAAGVVMLAAAFAYLLLCRFSRRHRLKLRGHTLALSSGRLAAWQSIAGGANWLLMGAIVWVLLGGRVEYPVVLGVLLLAAVAGVITHVPAGLGVLETVFVSLLSHRLPAEELLAAILAYRATYYLVPLALALPAYALSEASVRREHRAGHQRQEQPG